MRMYRLLLRVYPAWFRERFEAEILDAFADGASTRARPRAERAAVLDPDPRRPPRQRPRRAPRAAAEPAPDSPRHVMEALRLDLRHALVAAHSPPGVLACRGAVAGARHRRQRGDLRLRRRVRLPPVRVSRPRSSRHDRFNVPARVERRAVHRGHLGAGVPGHPRGAHAHVAGRRSTSATGTSREAIGPSAWPRRWPSPISSSPSGCGRSWAAASRADELAPGGPASPSSAIASGRAASAATRRSSGGR